MAGIFFFQKMKLSNASYVTFILNNNKKFNTSIKFINRLESRRGSFQAMNKVKQKCIATIDFVGFEGIDDEQQI